MKSKASFPVVINSSSLPQSVQGATSRSYEDHHYPRIDDNGNKRVFQKALQ